MITQNSPESKEIKWEELSGDEKKRALYEQQKTLLDTFLRTHAITQAQYKKSLGDLTVKMGMGDSTDFENRQL